MFALTFSEWIKQIKSNNRNINIILKRFCDVNETVVSQENLITYHTFYNYSLPPNA
jgi:hypothetical protein